MCRIATGYDVMYYRIHMCPHIVQTGATDAISSNYSTPQVPSHEQVTRKFFKIILHT
jgi:hypothetical protein